MIRFKTKHDHRLEMITMQKKEIPLSFVAMGIFYGENPTLLTELENRDITFVADIASNNQVYPEEPVVGIPDKKGSRGRLHSKLKVLNTSPVEVSSLSSPGNGWKLIQIRVTEWGNKTLFAMQQKYFT
jgi:hypothetical protein